MFVQVRGEKNAPAVVFVHGTGAWSEIWSLSMDDVVKSGYRAVAIDLPPFGYSIPPPSGKYDKGSQAKRILAMLDGLQIKKAIFVAHSIGSAPLMEALLQRPDRVSQLILVCGALGLDSPPTDGSDNTMQKILRQPVIAESLTSAVFTNPALTNKLVSSFVVEKDKLTPSWLAIYQQPLKLSGSYQSIAKWIPELIAGRGKWLSDNPEAYRKINFPVLLIWGQLDTITPLSQALHLQRLIPGSGLVVIPNSGHVPMVEEAELFESELIKALPVMTAPGTWESGR